MPVRILVPIDDSEASHQCELASANIAKVFGAELTLVHAIDTSGVDHKNISGIHLDMIREQARESARFQMKRAAEAMIKRGISARRILVEGTPRHEICAEADRGYDLLLLGAKVHSDLRQMFLGSVSSYLIHHCKTPLFIIKQGGSDLAEAAERGSLRILLSVDDTPASQRCVELIANLGVPGGLDVTLAHVRLKGITTTDPETMMAGYAKRLGVAGIKSTCFDEEGSEPGKMMAKLCEEGNFDVIVTGKAKPQELRARPVYSVGHFLFHQVKTHQLIVP